MDEALKIRLPLAVNGLVIRRIGPTDHDDLLEYWSAIEVARYQFWEPFTSDQIAAIIESQLELHPGDPGVALVLAAELNGKVIGDCQLTITSLDDRQAEIGFAFNPGFAGQGFATQAVAAVLGFRFLQLGMHRIVAGTDVRNERSWKLMERIGMRREAHFVHDTFAKGEWVDTYVYAMLDSEWQQRHSALVSAVA
jgi:RimJ/RimL family protein N-acetyltransferase